MNLKLNYGPRLKQFAFRPPEKDLPINILVGSVRSGKTWALHPKILYGCRYDVGGWRIITGTSKETIFNNVLNDLIGLVGLKHCSYNHQSGLLRICNTSWKVIGAKDEGSEKFLRGATIGYAVCDELVLMPKSFFQMLLTRLSPPGARLYGSTNPDSPMHWLKEEYLDKEVLRANKTLWSMSVTMDDNPNLGQQYIETQKSLYKGMFYLRFIEGLWVMAEGSIYRDAWDDCLLYDDDDAHPGLYNQGGHVDRWVSIDCGVDHPQVYLEFYDDGDTVWIRKEYFWDSQKEMRQKTDGQYADDLVEFMGRNNACQVIVPPECASFEAELKLRGLWVTEADNEVLEGIQTVSSMFAKRKIRIHKKNCPNLIRSIPIYVWDTKAALRGLEQPLKVKDDAPDCLRYGVHNKIPRWRLL